VSNDRCNIQVSDSPLDVEYCYDYLRAAEGGAVNLFVGTTRRMTDGIETIHLEYEAARELALAQMRKLADDAFERWPVLRLIIIHRIGTVPVSEASVVIGVATAHRDASFDACRFLIDELKKSVPVWKKERYVDGSGKWVEGTTPE
jgi:molybdopterin synthase catalytic subunit